MSHKALSVIGVLLVFVVCPLSAFIFSEQYLIGVGAFAIGALILAYQMFTGKLKLFG